MGFTREQYERFWTGELGKYQLTGNGHLRAPCYVHEGDATDTLSVDLNTGFAYCFKCHNGDKGWSMIEYTMARYGYSKEAAWAHVNHAIGNTEKPSVAPWNFPFPKPLAVTDDGWRLGTLAYRITQYVEWLDGQADAGGPGWEAYALYVYETIASVKVRVKHKVTGEKRMLWLSLTVKGGWSKPSKLGLEAPPYKARTLKGKEEIWLLNGEKAVDYAIEKWGIAASCLPNGEGHWKEAYLQWFLEAKVIYLVLDNDPSGEKHGTIVGGALAHADLEVRLVRLPGLPEHGDCYDYITAGGCIEEARAVANEAPLAEARLVASEPVKSKVRQMPGPAGPPLGGGGGGDTGPPLEGPDLVGYDRNDGGNAERLVAFAGDRLRYARHLEDCWLYYSGTRWKAGAVEEAYGPAITALALLKQQANAIDDSKLWVFANSHQNHGGLRAMIDLAKKRLAVDIAALDARPHLINCTNGTFDLVTDQLRPHAAADYLTHVFPFEYNPELPEPTLFLRSLFEWFGGTPESDVTELERIDRLIAYVQRILGYLLTGGVHEKAFFVLYGTGNNGKSTFVTTVQAILGEYGITISPSTLTKAFNKNENNANADIARSKGARAIFAAEPTEGQRFDQGLIKKLTQGEIPITGVFKAKQPFSFLPTGKLVLETNSIPNFDEDDMAFLDRMHTLRFPMKFPGGARAGQTRRDRLRVEDPQIFNWAVRGARDQHKNGLGEPLEDRKEQMAQIRDAMARNDGLEPFLEEYFVLGPDRRCNLSEIEALYRQWSERVKAKPIMRNRLSRMLCARADIRHGNEPGDHKSPAWLKGLAPKTKNNNTWGKDSQFKEPDDDE